MGSFRLSFMIFFAIALGIAFPLGPGAKPFIGLFLGLMLFLNFCRFNPREARPFRREILWALLLWMIPIPGATLLARGLLTPAQAMGLYLVAITPAAMGSPVIVHHLRGNFELSVTVVLLTSLVAPFLVPLSLSLVWGTETVSPWPLFWNVFGLISTPLVVATAVRQVKRWQPFVTKASHRANEVFMLLVYSSVATVADRLRALSLETVALLGFLALLLALLQFGVGYLLSRERSVRFALSVGLGQKNTGMTLWIAVMFLHPDTALIPVLYIIAQHLVSGTMMALARGEQTPVESR
jgi:BASS family bile acid:Na+ symporter